ncbi:MAG: BREX-2 system adenine-specific DNA-methyltransferase PglX [Deltaproteobacteria bacterium]|nr:BREX-2 system adenine-specific DNA-methyltransferase PglX [Deltaproteobacteria bacterium]
MATDLRARLLELGPIQERARQLHEGEHVGEAFELWTELLARRAAVLWVLKSVYVRVLEDRGLCRPLRIVDRGSQELFERLAPSLGETAYLKWIYRDLGTDDGGLPELFARQPAEIVLPSNDLSKALCELWRRRDPETGKLVYSFTEEHFDGRLMGDLYQDLDPVVKKRFALLQTPDFIVDFILNETLTPAIAEYGVGAVRVLDPSCGSGHFLLAAFKRLVTAMREQHPKRPVREIVADAIGRVVGIDLNDYACGLARARLVMTALELCGETELGAAAAFHPQVFCADALEQVERAGTDEMEQMPLLAAPGEKPPALMTRPEVRAALRPVLRQGFHAIVGNPPYITEKDKKAKEYHREIVERKGKQRRYVSAAGKYSLAAPFTERMLQLAVDGGFIGQITTNAFLKREFGKALIEEVLARADLYKVVDTSGAFIPGHGTPTVILFARRRRPEGTHVPVVMGKRGEPGKPEDPAKGKVWSSIAEGHASIGYENEFVSVSLVPRATLAQHPWSIGGGGAAELKQALDAASAEQLGKIAASIGITSFTLEDDVYIRPGAAWIRIGLHADMRRPMVEGDAVRDWSMGGLAVTCFPYDESLSPVAFTDAGLPLLWAYRTNLANNMLFGGKTKVQQIFQSKGAQGINEGIKAEAWERFYEHDGTKLQSFPLAATRHAALEAFAAHLDALARARVDDSARAAIDADARSGAAALRHAFAARRQRDLDRLCQMVGLQEELDWLCYSLYEVEPELEVRGPDEVVPLLPGQRPFEIVLAREDAERREALARGEEPDEAPTAWFERHGWEPVTELDAVADDKERAIIASRIERTAASKWLGLVEQPTYKRRWYRPKHEEQEQEALASSLADRIEDWAKGRERPFTVKEAALALEADPGVLAVAELLAGRSTFDLVALVRERVLAESVPGCKMHVYSEEGLRKRALWEQTWELQRHEDAGEKVTPAAAPKYGREDFQRAEYWPLRGKLDVPKERFIALTEVPGRPNGETLYGWAGWTARQRAKVLLRLDEELENQGVPLADRYGIVHGVEFLLPYVAWESAKAAAEFKAVVTSLVGQQGVTDAMLRQWAEKLGPPAGRSRARARAPSKAGRKRKGGPEPDR